MCIHTHTGTDIHQAQTPPTHTHTPFPHTFVLLEVQCVLFVCDDLLHVDHAAVVELAEDLDLSDGRDGEALLLIVQTHLLQSHQLTLEGRWNNMNITDYVIVHCRGWMKMSALWFQLC